MKKISLFLILVIFTNILPIHAQDGDKTVTITVSGGGKTQEEAKQSALRSAIEQAYGAFISSKTEILNDQVVADQMASVSSGNIRSFTILNESQLPDGSWANTIKAIVSVSKLTSFVESKGIAIEIKGGLFAINIKQQMLNEKGEIDAVSEMVGLLHEPMQTAFDYTIKSGEPKSVDTENKNWEIPLEVIAIANKNMDFCANYCIKTLTALSLSSEEVTSYQSLNKAVFPIRINYKSESIIIYLRKKISISALDTFISQWHFYTQLYSVETEKNKSHFSGGKDLHEFGSISYLNNREVKTINFLSLGQQAANFSWQDKRTITEIEEMTGYKVKPRGVISQFKQGGFVIYEIPPQYKIGIDLLDTDKSNVVVKSVGQGTVAEKAGILPGDEIISINNFPVTQKNMSNIINKDNNSKPYEFQIRRATDILKLEIVPVLYPGTGIVAAINDLESPMDWNSAKKACDDLVSNGFNDWRLPNKEVLNGIYILLKRKGIGGLGSLVIRDYGGVYRSDYWTSSEYISKDGKSDSNFHSRQNLKDGSQSDYCNNEEMYFVRAVRTF